MVGTAFPARKMASQDRRLIVFLSNGACVVAMRFDCVLIFHARPAGRCGPEANSLLGILTSVWGTAGELTRR